jgi:hypothetical protein
MFITKKKNLIFLSIAISLLMITPTVFSQTIENKSKNDERTEDSSIHMITAPAKKTGLFDEEPPIYTLDTDQNTPEDWWNESWQYRRTITIKKENIPKNLKNFTILLNIPKDKDFRDHCQSDGKDIVFTDTEKNKLYHEIEKFNETNGNLVAWIKFDLIKDIDNVFYMYYGNQFCDNQENKTMVWDEKYVLVDHLSEKVGTIFDSTLYENNGLYSGDLQDSIGKIDGSVSFDGLDDKIETDDNNSLDLTNKISLMAWVKYSKNDNLSTLINKEDSYSLFINSSGNIIFKVKIQGSDVKVPFNVTLKENLWSYLVLTYQNDSKHEIKLYVDGELKEINNSYQGLITTSDKDLLFGNDFDGNDCLNGSLDEIRVLKEVIDAEWIKTGYLSMNNSDVFIDLGSEESLNNIYQVSNMIGNETHPSVAVDEDGNIFAAYESDKDQSIKWVYSTDNGKSWKESFDFNIEEGFESNPAIDYWDYNRFYATFEPSLDDNHGGTIYILRYNLKGNVVESYFDFANHEQLPDTDPDWYGIKDMDIACDSSQKSHEFGVISLVASTNYPDAEVVNGPHIFYLVPELGEDDEISGNIVWEPKYSNCANSSIDIDKKTHNSYSVYEWFNESKSKLLVMMYDFANPPDNELGYNGILEIDEDDNFYHPSVGAYNNTVLIASETDKEGNKDIICKYSSDGFETETFSTSIIANSSDDEISPEIKWVKENTFICSFIRDGDLYLSKSTDGGKTWNTPVLLNDNKGSVVEKHQSFDLANRGQKVIWSDNREVDNINVFIGDTGVEMLKQPASLRVVGFTGGFGLDTTICNDGDFAAKNIDWTIRVDGKRIFKKGNSFEETGKVKSLSGGFNAGLDTLVFWGFGPVTVSVTVDAENADTVNYSKSGFLVGPFILFNRPRVKVSGMVFDEDSGDELGFVKISAKKQGSFIGNSVRSNLIFEKGAYEIYLKPGIYNITIKRIGYIQEDISLNVKNGVTVEDLNFYLKPKN